MTTPFAQEMKVKAPTTSFLTTYSCRAKLVKGTYSKEPQREIYVYTSSTPYNSNVLGLTPLEEMWMVHDYMYIHMFRAGFVQRLMNSWTFKF